jgi:hypothetical protein
MPRHAVEDRYGARVYTFGPPIVPEPVTAPSVTTILRAFPKHALTNWAARTVAEWAWDHRDAWLGLDRAPAVDLLKREPLRQVRTAGNRGVDVHAALAELVAGGEPEAAGYDAHLEGLRAFVADWQPEPVAVEAEVLRYRTAPVYAGSVDLVARLSDQRLWLIDLKTSKGVYPDHALQLGAYACADVLVAGDTAAPMPRVQRAGLLHVTGAGYQLVPVAIPRGELLVVFEALAVVSAFCDRKDALGAPAAAPIPA